MRRGIDEPVRRQLLRSSWRCPTHMHDVTTATTWDHVHELAFEFVHMDHAPYSPPQMPSGVWKDSLTHLQNILHKCRGIDAAKAAKLLFYRERAAIYVELRDNSVFKFVPFANAQFKNDWPPYCEHLLAAHFKKKWQHMRSKENILPFERWWCANNLLCNVLPPDIISSKSQLVLRDMLETVCKERGPVPNCAFFINPRDGPIMRRDGVRTCPRAWRPFDKELATIDYMLPIFSFYSSPHYFDCPCPTANDWVAATQRTHLGRTPPQKSNTSIEFASKRSAAIWRGSLTGPGNNALTNDRIALVQEPSSKWLDVRATSTNCTRCRVCPATGNIVSVNPKNFCASRQHYVPFATQQEKYRYNIVLCGHGAPDRWPRALEGNQVVLRKPFEHTMWFDHAVTPDQHYILMRDNPATVVQQLEQNVARARDIARAAQSFSQTRFSKDGILDWWQTALFALPPTCKTGRNVSSPCPILEGYRHS